MAGLLCTGLRRRGQGSTALGCAMPAGFDSEERRHDGWSELGHVDGKGGVVLDGDGAMGTAASRL